MDPTIMILLALCWELSTIGFNILIDKWNWKISKYPIWFSLPCLLLISVWLPAYYVGKVFPKVCSVIWGSY